MNTSRSYIPLIILYTLVVLVGMFCLTIARGNTVRTDNGTVKLVRTDVKSDPGGGMTGTSVTNYSFLVDMFGGYSNADAVQKYLSAYLRLAHDESYPHLTIEESSVKEDRAVVSFTAHYGDNTPLKVSIDTSEAEAIRIRVISDNGAPSTYDSGSIEVDVVN